MEFRKVLFIPAVALLVTGMASARVVPGPLGAGPGQPLTGGHLVDFEMAEVKSAADLEAYLRDPPEDSPLMALSPEARQRFIDSLVFNENGLVSYGYADIARELTVTQAYRLLALFGAQRTTHLIGARVESEVDATISETPMAPQIVDGARDQRSR